MRLCGRRGSKTVFSCQFLVFSEERKKLASRRGARSTMRSKLLTHKASPAFKIDILSGKAGIFLIGSGQVDRRSLSDRLRITHAFAMEIPSTDFQMRTACRLESTPVCCLAWGKEPVFPARPGGQERGRPATTKNKKAGLPGRAGTLKTRKPGPTRTETLWRGKIARFAGGRDGSWCRGPMGRPAGCRWRPIP